VAQIFVDAISTEPCVVAIVIPDEAYVRKNFPGTNNQASFADLCQSPSLKEIILADLKNLAETHKLKKYETLTNIHLHPEMFSPKNGLLTVTFKTKRTNARKQFQSTIASLYESNNAKTNHV
jgi:long-chain acyl-CoA synthetase